MADSPRTRPSAPSPTDARRIQDEEAYPYIITQEIGKGSFATVYKGYHNVSLTTPVIRLSDDETRDVALQKSRKAVAIKTVSRSILTHKLLENLESEISILKALTHKHITELKDIVVCPVAVVRLDYNLTRRPLFRRKRVTTSTSSWSFVPEETCRNIFDIVVE